MSSKVFSIGLMLVLWTAAGLAQENLPVLESPYYPLKVGNKWHYRTGDQKVAIRVDKLEVREFKKDGKDTKVACHRLVVTKDDREKSECVAVLEDGIYRFAGDDKDISPPLRFLMLPLKKGDSWEAGSTLDNLPLKGKFTAGEEKITVPAGQFETTTVSCPDFQIGPQKMAMEYWFAQKVGIVKQRVKIGTYEVVLELEKFEPAK